MGPRVSIFLTVIGLIALQAAFPFLIDHWLITIAKSLPSFFSLGLTTVLLYKAFRYPRGTGFTIVGLLQIALSVWALWMLYINNLTWLAIPLVFAALVFGPRSARATWILFDVDRYYRK